MPNPALGEVFRSRREALGLSREKLAYESGVSVATIIRLERGDEPKPVRLQAIADRLGLTVEPTRAQVAS